MQNLRCRWAVHLALAASLADGSSVAYARDAFDNAGNRMMPLPAVGAVAPDQRDSRSGLHCNAARDFCLQAQRDGDTSDAGWQLWLYDRVPTPTDQPLRQFPLPSSDDPAGESIAIWPHLVREASGATLIGVERYRRTGFSGGGAGQTDLVLLRLTPGAAEPVPVMTVQTGYTAMIRACFSEDDMRRLRDACHQQLEFEGTLTLAPDTATGAPRFDLNVASRVFPRGSLVDGWETRALTRQDRVWEPDPVCTYRRRFSPEAATGSYAPEEPLPDCSLYSLP